MKININKDFEEAYKENFFKGFTMKETFCIALALAIAIGVAAFFTITFSLPINVSIYLGLPFAAPVLIIGFKKFQGLTLVEYIKELIYENQIKELYYDADEATGNKKAFSMEHEDAVKKKRKKRKRN